MNAPGRTPEEQAWWTIHQLPVRGKYEHPLAYKRRTRKRANFLSRVQRRPNGCWVWTGPTVKGGVGTTYPAYYHRQNLGEQGDNTTSSAFPWMMREWFPNVQVRQYEQTDTRCGNMVCISPYHRVRRKPSGGEGTGRMSHELVREIYSRRLTSTVNATALEFRVHGSQVSRIWTGERWSAVTGERSGGVRKRMSAEQALAVYALRNSGRKSTEVAKEFGISRPTVYAIWTGRSWAATTHHGLSEEQGV